MKGKLITAMSKNREVRIYVAETTDMVESARVIHDLSPMSTAALGRTLTAASIMGMMSKIDKEKLTFQVKGSGEIKLMVAVADTHGRVKAYISEPHAENTYTENGRLDVGNAVGKEGQLIIIRDYGMKEPFIGQTALVSGEIAEDLAAYFIQSEQQPTAVSLGVKLSKSAHVAFAGGFIVQILPETSEESLTQLESNLSGLGSMTALFDEGLDMMQIANQVFAGMGLDELETYELNYSCDCSREKMEMALIGLGEKEIKAIIDEDGKAELTCHFCNTAYQFNQAELLELVKRTKMA